MLLRSAVAFGLATTAVLALTPQRNSTQTQRTGPPRPHIAYLLVDDWGWANFGPHRVNNTSGNDEFETPNLAALAQEGIMLNRM